VTEHVREWLPRDAFTTDVVRPALTGLLADWSQRWFRRARADVGDVEIGAARSGQTAIVEAECAEVALSGPGKRHLLEALLGAALSGPALSKGDHRLLDAFATDAVADLLARIDALAAGRGRDGALLAIALTLDGREMARLFLPEDVLVPAMKAAMARRRNATEAPQARLLALNPVCLTVEAVLGRADLALGDLRHLSVGDVVVLDTSVREPVELLLSGTARCIGRGRLGRDGSIPTVQF